MTKFKYYNNLFSYKKIKHIGAREMTKNKRESDNYFGMLHLMPSLMETDLEYLRYKLRTTNDHRERKTRLDAMNKLGYIKHKKGDEEEYTKMANNFYYGKALTQLMSDKQMNDCAGDLGVINEEDWKDKEGWF